MFVLDTNVISELRRAEKGDARVFAWGSSHGQSDFYLSAVTILEIALGARLLARKDKSRGAVLLTWIDRIVLPEFEGRILPVDVAVARRCALLHIPTPMGKNDALIAATALVHGMQVATRNVVDFERTGVKLINPWLQGARK